MADVVLRYKNFEALFAKETASIVIYFKSRLDFLKFRFSLTTLVSA